MQLRERTGSLTGAATTSAPREVASRSLIGARYETLNELGSGGFGSVYRALDRLTGRVVTLKRLRVVPQRESSRAETRRVLAQEFRVLASLRHPNVISVLDYGFDEHGEPFLVMDLAENARTIVEAARGAPTALQADLLVQTARALLYLHRLGIIHRDLKPDNILVVNEQVKVLDFGLALRRDLHQGEATEVAGTPAYMAPEILRGEPPNEQSDLYALGIIAYEIFIGQHPFASVRPVDRAFEMQRAVLPRPGDPVDARLRPVLSKLLHAQASERYGTAAAAIADLGEAVGHALAAETVATRESFLQAAPFVGRQEELGTLRAGLAEARAGRGASWLIAGESGVGKSRLLDELRILGLVDGFVALRGQGINRGGAPYHIWRDIISNLVLRVEVSPAEAAVLRMIVPDIARMVGFEVGEAPSVDSANAQSRLQLCVESLFRRQRQPLLVALEDLQWAGSESVKLFSWLTLPTESMRVLFVASLRDDEAPSLRDSIAGASVLRLARLDSDSTAALAEAMIGAAAHRPGLLRFIERETEGIPFYIVEVMRALAESSGALDRIEDAHLPERIQSGGIQRIVQRRIDLLPAAALPALRTAAVIGRQVDAAIMRAAYDGLDVEDWADTCERRAVLELQEGRWRFAHDKLREQLLVDLSPDVHRTLHRHAAEATERAYPDRRAHLAALAYHWREAGESDHEAHYAREAGRLALANGAHQEAVTFLSRALEIRRHALSEDKPPAPRARRTRWLDPNSRVDPDDPAFELTLLDGWLSEAFYRLGDMTKCELHATRAMDGFQFPVPRSAIGWIAAVCSEALRRALQPKRQQATAALDATRRVASEAGRVQLRLTDVYFYSLRSLPIVWSSLRIVNQCEPAGPSPELAQGYAILAVLSGTAQLRRLGDPWAQRALEIARSTGLEQNVAWVQSRFCAYEIPECHWNRIDVAAAEAAVLAEKVGDLRLLVETLLVQANVDLYRGCYERGLAIDDEALRLSRRAGNRQAECWAILGQGGMLIRLGRCVEAEPLAHEALELTDQRTMKSERICALGGLALARLWNGNPNGAYEAAQHAVALMREIRPVAYWLQQPMAMTCETLLTLSEMDGSGSTAHRKAVAKLTGEAVGALRTYAKTLPLGRPYAQVWGGLHDWQRGHKKRAMQQWQQAMTLAEQLQTPFELARGHFEIGRHLAESDPQRQVHLRAAQDGFERLSCRLETGRVHALTEEKT